ncbi:MAG: hypothetical protein J6V92_00520, partial [Bacteroidaceae bacterium]|nr:hypothetical protein [Bacteroidaceae bacterium]
MPETISGREKSIFSWLFEDFEVPLHIRSVYKSFWIKHLKVLNFVEMTKKNASFFGLYELFRLEPIDNRQETLDSICTLLQEFKELHEKFVSQLEKLNATISLNLKTEDDVQWLKMFANMISSEKERDELHETILSSYSEDILKMDVNAYRREWEEVKSKWFLPRYFAKKKYLKSLQVYGQVFESGVENMLKLVGDYQNFKKSLKV